MAHEHTSQVITSLDVLYSIKEKLSFQFGWKQQLVWVEHKLPELSSCLFSTGLTISKCDEDCVLDVTFWSKTSECLLLLLMLLAVINVFQVNCRIFFGSLDILWQIISCGKYLNNLKQIARAVKTETNAFNFYGIFIKYFPCKKSYIDE